ncbi:long-chain-fatty-acid--CoA ligase [Paenibacillus sp. BSR1-1]|uniref:long-chain-fatty-acid--CoA ligase n=1 Tax=Paenibacillus sp. BSR1-1 TaxID=3020845 RepID=UPI0025B168C5|nr:long-chain-fatty-acid--CoA ligase [Paenibacillus sp. BSR1-1]MDN3016280.1 long-chain-fatty-acid--CoA ligase [Paenibacillus sp. BSR1-1]
MTLNLNENLKNSAARFPNHTAYTYLYESTTYAELDKVVDSAASGLSAEGIRKGDRVALMLGNCSEFVIAYYGILRAGAVVVPINPAYTSGEISYILSNSQAKALIAHSFLEQKISPLREKLENLKLVIYTDSIESEWTWERLIHHPKEVFENPSIDEDDLAVILYTSGTTGKPKGAMLSHRNMASNTASMSQLGEFTEEDRIIAVLPMFHVFCIATCINIPIACGAAIVIVPKFSPNEVIKTIRREKATIFAGVPTMFSFLFQVPGTTAEDFSSIRACFSGGASIPVELLHRFEEKYKVHVLEGYGLSETAPVTAFNPLRGTRKPGSVGIDIPEVKNKVVDLNGVEVPRGEIGELIVQGPNVMMGYLGMPEATSSALKDGWFYTGDLARMDEEGYIYIVDRKKDMILVGGYNVYPREVEEVLYQHPAIVETVVIGIPDKEYGEIVKAFVVTNDEGITTDDIQYFCQDKLAKYKLPKQVEFMSELPKNSTGKILRRALRVEQVEVN